MAPLPLLVPKSEGLFVGAKGTWKMNRGDTLGSRVFARRFLLLKEGVGRGGGWLTTTLLRLGEVPKTFRWSSVVVEGGI